MKAFIAEGTGAAQQLSGIQNEKIPIYGSKAAAEADIENLEENQIVATKENGFSSDGVYIASSSAIIGGDLIANSSMKIMFISDIVGEDTSTPLSISWNGESYLVKVANNSQLQNIYAHEVSSGVFKYVQAYTTLELIFDGVQFIIVGNPLVLSSSSYSIYANGYNDAWTELASFSSASSITIPKKYKEICFSLNYAGIRYANSAISPLQELPNIELTSYMDGSAYGMLVFNSFDSEGNYVCSISTGGARKWFLYAR